jgi:S-adenosylmethionine hydrolase
MAEPVITLTTDFGLRSPYAAAMKGVILGINPQARVIDLSHSIPPQDLRQAAFFLRHAVPYFPADVIHVVVVDPGVGTERALLYVKTGSHQLLVPDNGCWTVLADQARESLTVIRLTQLAYWRCPVSATFHGRDILAPAAAHLSLGVDPARLGVVVTEWVGLETASLAWNAEGMRGEVVFVDDFGNLITNIPAEFLVRLATPPKVVQVGERMVRLSWVETYGQAGPGTVVGLVGSGGTFEIAVAQGNAARQLAADMGTPVLVVVEG